MTSDTLNHRATRRFGRALLFIHLLCLSIGPCVYAQPVAAPVAPAAPERIGGVEHPAWSENLAIYEVNVRQYSPGGTFREFEQHLPRLKEMGVGILWFMPIHPIGEQGRKGTLGSYYAVRDYLAVNPEYGTMDEFKALVRKIHDMGMYVIIDWVPNHTAWDNPLTVEHPDWFTKDENGDFTPPVPDWSDVIDLNYENPELRRYMIDAMKFWVEQVGVDGFRCDVAGMVPIDFWNQARAELEQIKPVFMLAEADAPELHEQAFDMTYGWGLSGVMHGIAKGEMTAADIDAYLQREAEVLPNGAYRMNFTSNHDENSWNGSAPQRLGPSAEAFAVLVATVEGMPLIYSGQEAWLDKKLAFFDKDQIEWRPHEMADLYTTLLHLKREHAALWNGEAGGRLARIPTSNDEAVFAFAREKAGDKVLVILNLTDRPQAVTLDDEAFTGNYTEVFTGEAITLTAPTTLELRAWDYRVFVR